MSCIPYRTIVRRWSTVSCGWMFDERATKQCTGWPHCFTTELPVFIADGWLHFYLIDSCSPVSLAININAREDNKARLISLLSGYCAVGMSTNHMVTTAERQTRASVIFTKSKAAMATLCQHFNHSTLAMELRLSCTNPSIWRKSYRKCCVWSTEICFNLCILYYSDIK